MKLKFTQPAATADEGFKQGHEYDFIDHNQAMRFIESGIAVPVEDALPPKFSPKKPSKEPQKS